MTLDRAVFNSLCSALREDPEALFQRVRADMPPLPNPRPALPVSEDGTKVHVKRSALETYLRSGVDVRAEHQVETARVSPSKQVELVFSNSDAPIHPRGVVVACDGIHSATRKSLIPTSASPRVLPYAVITGTRKMMLDEWQSVYEGHFLAPTPRNKITLRMRGALLHVWLDDFEADKNEVKIRHVYSRPSKGEGDSLHNPDRTPEGAKEIPESYFEELKEIAKELPAPFDEVFDVERIRRNDRLLHWLMRTSEVPLKYLTSVVQEAGVVFVGDAVHGHPILGGTGASEAIKDGLDLAQVIVQGQDLTEFYRAHSESWMEAVKNSEKELERMHSN